MNRYRFALQKDGTRIEEFGVMALPDDGKWAQFRTRG